MAYRFTSAWGSATEKKTTAMVSILSCVYVLLGCWNVLVNKSVNSRTHFRNTAWETFGETSASENMCVASDKFAEGVAYADVTCLQIYHRAGACSVAE